MKITAPFELELISVLDIVWALSGLLATPCKAQLTTKRTVPSRYVKNQNLIGAKLDVGGKNQYMLLDTIVDTAVIACRIAEVYDLKVDTDDEGERRQG